MSVLRRFGIVYALILVATPVASGSEVITLDELQRLALRNHPAGAGGEALRQIGRAELSLARTWSDPTVQGLIGSADPVGPEPSKGESGFEITQELPSPIAYKHRIQAAEFGVAEREAEAKALQLDVMLAVELLYFDLAAVTESARILEGNAQGAQGILEITSRRAELGEARETERIRAEIELLRIRRAAASASREVEIARESLRRTVGTGLPERFEVEPLWPGASSLGELSDLQERVATRNPELIAARARLSRTEESARAAGWQAWPDLSATYYDLDEIDKTARGALLSVRVPLWNANRPEAARQRAEASLARADVRVREIEVGNALDRAYREFRVSAEQASLFVERLLPAAAESLRLAELTYAEGESSFLELLDAQRTYREAAGELIDIRREAARALAAIHRLTGGTDVNDNS